MPRRYRDLIFSDEEKDLQLLEITRKADEEKERLIEESNKQGKDFQTFIDERKLHKERKYNKLKNKRDKI